MDDIQQMVAVELWGNALWRSIHAVALGYAEGPEDRRKSPSIRLAYRAWFTALSSTLPCDTCRDGYASHMVSDSNNLLAQLDEALADVGNPYALFEWTVKLHNCVAQRQGKEDAWTVERALKDFQDNNGAPPGPGVSAVSIGAHGIALAIGFLVTLVVLAIVYYSIRYFYGCF